MEEERILSLLEDADKLNKLLAGAKPDVTNIRALGGVILRKWLLNNEIKRVVDRLQGRELKIEHISNSTAEANLRNGRYGLWVGNFSFNDIVLQVEVPATEGEARLIKSGCSEQKLSSFKNFKKQRVCHVLGKTFTRQEVINFHANQLGGAHFDPDKVASRPTLKRLRETVGYEVNETGNIKMRLGSEILVAKKDPSRRQDIYDLADLIVLDAAKRFSSCILNEADQLRSLI